MVVYDLVIDIIIVFWELELLILKKIVMLFFLNVPNNMQL